MPLVGQLLPVIQTKPFASTWMPCSRSGHCEPASSPPHALTNAPAVSNTTTGGAAASPALTVRGRCSSQTLSLASMAKLDASPSFHCGGTFGHALSTSNSGRLRVLDWASTTMVRVPKSAAAMMTDPMKRARATCVPQCANESLRCDRDLDDDVGP